MNKIYFRHDSFNNEQQDIIKDIIKSVKEKKSILIHAPTGCGKTDAAFSAVINNILNDNLKIIFVTSKNSQHKMAIEVINGINEKYNLEIKAIDLVGKQNLCIDRVLSEKESGFYELCEQQIKNKKCKYFENIKPQDKSKRESIDYSIKKELTKHVYDHHEIKNIAKNFKGLSIDAQPICAYELAKKHAKNCQIIIGDYYHIFSKETFNALSNEINIDLEKTILIVDEAHNLEERLIKLLSKSINIFMLNKAIKECENLENEELKDIIETIKKNIEKIVNKQKEEEIPIKKEDILTKEIIKDVYKIIEDMKVEGIRYIEKINFEKNSAILTIALFLEAWVENKEPEYIRFIKNEKNTISVKYLALDASKITKNIFSKTYSNILMSATLSPLNMYQEIYGFNKDECLLKEYGSPFDIKNKINLLIDDVSTKYEDRCEKEYKKIGEHITKVLKIIKGNIIIFFPSFELMFNIDKYITTNKMKLKQESKQSTYDFENMIKNFKLHSHKEDGCALLAVMGGKASEGIDLPGKFVIGAIIVGIPFAKINYENKQKIKYYEMKYHNGQLYAYIQPAIQKVIQSAGRVIRSKNDKGIIIFMDKRYNLSKYRACLPKNHLFKKKITKQEIIDFYNKC